MGFSATAKSAELVLGSVQLGLAYGAANQTGKPSHAAALALVGRARLTGIATFDTARAYGDAEERLGEALAEGTSRIVTKLSPLSDLGAQDSRDKVREAVDIDIERSLTALKRERLDCLLLHRAQHRTQFDGAIWQRLLEWRDQGRIGALGVSVQSPGEALAALECADVRHMQLPFNLLDDRWHEAGVIDAARARPDVVMHARSVFLQGILASDNGAVWPKVKGLDSQVIRDWLAYVAADLGRASVADLCLAFVRGQDWLDGIVIGMETLAQLDANLALMLAAPLSAEECRHIEAVRPRLPEALLDPAQWPRS